MPYYVNRIQNGTELYHHGILGQKWGVRRFQNKDGSLTRAGRKRAMKTYDYKSSDKYKNASSSEKRKQTNTYKTNRLFLGKKRANRIAYKVNEEGKNRTAVTATEAGKRVTKGLLITAAIPVAIAAGTVAYATGKGLMLTNNASVDLYAKMEGLNVENHRGFSTGFSGLARGAKIFGKVADAEKGQRRVKQIAASRTVRNW